MPNHTHCILTLAEDSDKGLWEILKPYMGMNSSDDPEYILDLNKIIPMPPEIEATLDTSVTPSDGMPNWYNWRNEHWGTKWNTYLIDFEDRFTSDNDYCFHFYTAWGPPIPCIVKLSELVGLSLQLDYLDEGEMFIGRLVAHPGGDYKDKSYGAIGTNIEKLQTIPVFR
jgi:hypothetical protein